MRCRLEETRKGVVAREVAPELPAVVRIPTYVHVIKGTHRGERVPAGPKRVRKAISILNNAMAGNQSNASAPARYRFILKEIDYTKRDGWHHAFFNGPRDQRMKRALHRGNERTLNLYINGGGPRNEPVLGWSRFPWQYRGTPRLDHVSVNFAALPGGKATGYNRGDTLVHETGHWLGLFHTFEGGCRGDGDVVADTPAEGEPSYYCETTRDTCKADTRKRPGAQLHGLLPGLVHEPVHPGPGGPDGRGVREVAVVAPCDRRPLLPRPITSRRPHRSTSHPRIPTVLPGARRPGCAPGRRRRSRRTSSARTATSSRWRHLAPARRPSR